MTDPIRHGQVKAGRWTAAEARPAGFFRNDCHCHEHPPVSTPPVALLLSQLRLMGLGKELAES